MTVYEVEHEVDEDGEDGWHVVNKETGEIVESFWTHAEAIELAEKLNAETKSQEG
jgi:hypothetical protein